MNSEIKQMMDNAIQQLKEEQKLREEYEQTPEFIKYYEPIQNQWTSVDFNLVQDGGDLADQFTIIMGKFDFYEEHDLHKTCTPIVERDGRMYETTLVIYYNFMKKMATYFVGYDEKFSQEDIEKSKPFCPCPICKSSWWNLMNYFACRGCYGCLQCDELCGGHPSYKEHLKEAAKNMRNSK